MNARRKRRALVIMASALVISLAAPLSSAVPADATLPPSGSSAATAAGALRRQHRIEVLTAALRSTLTAGTSGYVTDTISPSKLKLPAGTHVLQLRSMLFTATRTFTSG